jgi:hypothetical protein
MKPYKVVMIAAALTIGTSVAMAQSASGPSTKQQQTESDLNKSVGDGSSGGKNVGAQEKSGAAANTKAAPMATTGSGASANTPGERDKVGVPKEGKGGDAVNTTGTAKANEKKQ